MADFFAKEGDKKYSSSQLSNADAMMEITSV
jgi:hypothetical protein